MALFSGTGNGVDDGIHEISDHNDVRSILRKTGKLRWAIQNKRRGSAHSWQCTSAYGCFDTNLLRLLATMVVRETGSYAALESDILSMALSLASSVYCKCYLPSC
jgi:hypothetical protein